MPLPLFTSHGRMSDCIEPVPSSFKNPWVYHPEPHRTSPKNCSQANMWANDTIATVATHCAADCPTSNLDHPSLLTSCTTGELPCAHDTSASTFPTRKEYITLAAAAAAASPGSPGRPKVCTSLPFVWNSRRQQTRQHSVRVGPREHLSLQSILGLAPRACMWLGGGGRGEGDVVSRRAYESGLPHTAQIRSMEN